MVTQDRMPLTTASLRRRYTLVLTAAKSKNDRPPARPAVTSLIDNVHVTVTKRILVAVGVKIEALTAVLPQARKKTSAVRAISRGNRETSTAAAQRSHRPQTILTDPPALGTRLFHVVVVRNLIAFVARLLLFPYRMYACRHDDRYRGETAGHLLNLVKITVRARVIF